MLTVKVMFGSAGRCRIVSIIHIITMKSDLTLKAQIDMCVDCQYIDNFYRFIVVTTSSINVCPPYALIRRVLFPADIQVTFPPPFPSMK